MMLCRNGYSSIRRLSFKAQYMHSFLNNTETTIMNSSNILRQGKISSPMRSLSAFTPSRIVNERIKINVPTMGDSITEGTIVEWCVPIGGYANEGDVVALIETDKVTVDIKAEESGLVITHYGNVDDAVEVGSNLYQIDTEAQPTASSDSTPSAVSPAATEEENAVKTVTETTLTEAKTTTSERIPSIHFLGKEGWTKKLQGITTVEEEEEDTRPTIIYMDDIDPMYGRPIITDEEMDALVLGGASLAPELIHSSKHPVFK